MAALFVVTLSVVPLFALAEPVIRVAVEACTAELSVELPVTDGFLLEVSVCPVVSTVTLPDVGLLVV